MTWDGMPAAMLGWACRIPSSSHSNPKPIRSTWCPAGSPTALRDADTAPWAAPGPRTLTQATDSTAKISKAIRPWWPSAAWNAATTVGSLTFKPLFIPGIALANLRDLHCRPTSVTLPRAAGCRRGATERDKNVSL